MIEISLNIITGLLAVIGLILFFIMMEIEKTRQVLEKFLQEKT